MRTQIIHASAPGSHADRIVLLPGAYHELEQFAGAGFDRALRDRGLAAELILAAPELAHLNDRSWLAQLRAQVITPARERGRGALWLGGISLGGFMALRYAADGQDALDGLCLLAPYLGSRIVAAEVAAHESLASWQPAALDADDDDRRIWRYVRGLRTAAAPRVFLGFGSEDRFADSQRLLAGALPATSTRVISGGHDWPVWRRLWELFLDLLGERSDAQSDGGRP
jgi:pimeloyl-ACP methyl ester carboxylesterase